MKESPKDFFDRESTRYDKFVKKRDFVLSLTEKVTPLLKGKILDAGSGCINDFKKGDFALYIPLDLSLGMLSRLDQDGKMRAVCGDATCLPFQNDSFNVIIYRSLLHHLNPEGKPLREMGEVVRRTLSEAKRVLGHDGKIIIIEPCLSLFFEGVERWFALAIRFGMKLAGLPYVFLFSRQRLSLFLQRAGWDDVKLTKITGTGKRWEWIVPIWGLPFFKIPRWLAPSQVYLVEGGRRYGKETG